MAASRGSFQDRTGPRPAIYLAGPTAVGKSAVALEVARALNGEIVSVDSMQVYRGMDIGTAKPTPSERAAITHHAIDVVDLTATFDVAEFVRLAGEAELSIVKRGKTALFSGGTGLYFRAYLEGLGGSPPSDPVLRRELESQPLEKLLADLRARDPVTYERIDRTNPRRVFRALEVVLLTGRSFSEQRAAWRKPGEADREGQAMFFGLERHAEDLRRRIDARVEHMFGHGFIEEVRRLANQGLPENRTASQALGYRQVLAFLAGQGSEAETIDEVKRRTRQYAKRQMTWFRYQMRLEWIPLEPEADPVAVAKQIVAAYKRRSCGSSCG